MRRPGRHRRRVSRFLQEILDAAVGVRADDAERARLLARHRKGGDRHVGVARPVEIDHLADIHPVHVVGAEHGDYVRIVLRDQVQVLVHRVRRPLEPHRPFAHLRRHDGDEMVRQQGESAHDRCTCSISDCDLYWTSR
jgi:hypothetical protein